ncbi:MAG: glycosyltransferase family 4 protein, partial [Anaerotignum sp.]|nr:glycosyltransferase family 4 protein [Anaerotignum sp.]
KAMKALVQLFKEERPDIVHTHASMTARMAARAAMVPSIFNTKHCMESASGILPKKIVRREVNAAFSDKIIAVSRAVRRSMVHAGCHPEQIAVVYNGIEPISIPSAEEKAALLQSYGGRPGEKAVDMVARLEEVKDHETFLLGAQNVLENRKDVRFYIVGDGSLREELERRVLELGISEWVTFTGFIKDVEKIEAALDIAVITSKAEALCLSIIESNIAGVPAVGTDSGGVAEVIKDGETGYLVPVGDADALAARIEDLLADDAKRKAFGEQAKKYAESMFMAEKMTKRIEKLYLEARK